jgi:hypothetical protein
MLTNPVYTGMGPYPAIIQDEDWLDVNARLIEEDGSEVVIHSILAQFQEAFPDLRVPNVEPLVGRIPLAPRETLLELLVNLRSRASTLAGENS